MANELQVKTTESPRFDGNTLKWYVGNTFPYTMEIELLDKETGDPIEISAGDKIEVCFFDKKRNEVHKFEFGGLTPYTVDERQFVEITLNFDETVTAKFAVGDYTYCTTYYGEWTSTIWANAEAEVLRCH